MYNLEKDVAEKVEEYLKETILNFDNFPADPQGWKNSKEEIYSRLISRKWSGSAQTEAAKELTKATVENIFKKNLPFIFCFCFGGYKHFWSDAYPEPDWAEVFTIRFLLEYLSPIIRNWKVGVSSLEFESEEVFVDLINNMPREAIEKYKVAFYKLLDYIQKKLTMSVELKCVLARDLYNIDELFRIVKEYEPEVAERLRSLDATENAIRLKRAASNYMWKGEKDLSGLSPHEKEKVIFQSRVTNEAFLDADYALRGKSFFERENLIPLLGTFGLYAGGENWLHLMSTSSSLVDFWSGIGILELREDRIIPKIISQNQFKTLKDNLVKLELGDLGLNGISKNFGYIYFHEGAIL